MNIRSGKMPNKEVNHFEVVKRHVDQGTNSEKFHVSFDALTEKLNALKAKSSLFADVELSPYANSLAREALAGTC